MLKPTIQLLCFACLIAATSRAADEPFIGKWKLNLSKSKLADQMSLAPSGANRYTLTFAGAGETETLVADGTDQPGIQGSTISITVEAPGNWKIVRKSGGRTVLTAMWKLFADGSASSSGIPGTWETTEEKPESAYEIEIRPYEGDGLSFINPGGAPATNVKFDGKDYPPAGAGRSE